MWYNASMAKNEFIHFRVDEADKRQLERVAASYCMTQSEFILRMCRWVEKTQPRLIIEPQKERANDGLV